MDNITHSLTGWALGQAGLKTKSPFDAAQDVLLVARVLPHILPVPQRGIEHLSLALGFAPTDREMAAFALLVRMLVQHKKIAHLGPVVILEQVDFLLFDTIRFTQVLG